jgi:hypothetical protein
MSTTITSASISPLPVAAAVAPQQSTPAPNPAELVFQSALGYIVSACLNVAVKMRIPDLIGEGVYELGALARRAGAQEDALFRVLRVLEMNGLVTRNGHRSYELTPSGQLLRRDSEGSLAAAVEWISDPLHLTLYSGLQSSIETGETTFDAVYGMPFFDWSAREENAEEAGVFNNAMTSVSQLCIPAFLEAYSFGSFERIVDVGGGHGAVLRSILKEHAGVSGTLAEMASLIPAANAAIANDGLSNRCEAVACNFFESVPAGGDLYFMKHIVHDWADEPALQLLRNIRAAIRANGTLLLAEAVLDDSPAPHLGKLLDIEMIAFVGGKERTAAEFRQLLAKAGFALQRVVQTRSPLSLLEAVPC